MEGCSQSLPVLDVHSSRMPTLWCHSSIPPHPTNPPHQRQSVPMSFVVKACYIQRVPAASTPPPPPLSPGGPAVPLPPPLPPFCAVPRPSCSQCLYYCTIVSPAHARPACQVCWHLLACCLLSNKDLWMLSSHPDPTGNIHPSRRPVQIMQFQACISCVCLQGGQPVWCWTLSWWLLTELTATV